MIPTSKFSRRMSITVLMVAIAVAIAGNVRLHAQDSFTVFLKAFDAATGESVTDLRPDEITVLEDGEARDVVEVEPIDWPVKLTVLIDNGAVLAQALPQIREGLQGLIEALPEGVEVELVTIAPQPRFIVRMTSDRAEVLDGLDRIAPDSGSSTFVDALVEASDRIRDDDSGQFPVVLMVAGNGTDSSSGMDRKFRRLQEQTIEQPVTNHFVMWTGFLQNPPPNAGLQADLATQLAEITGGRLENLASAPQFTTLLPEFGKQVTTSHESQRNQVRVTYVRPDDAQPPQKGVSTTVSRPGLGAILTIDGRMP